MSQDNVERTRDGIYIYIKFSISLCSSEQAKEGVSSLTVELLYLLINQVRLQRHNDSRVGMRNLIPFESFIPRFMTMS